MTAPPTLAIVACLRDEADVLPAWLAYHRALGATRAYCYVDRCTDGTVDLLRAHDWVEIIPARRGDGQSLEHLQLVCADDALSRARAAGIDWLLHLDADELAWGGPLADQDDPLTAGSLPAMLARAAPATEAVLLRTLEAVTVRVPRGTPFWAVHAMVAEGVIARDVLDPDSGALVRLDRWLGHRLGKSAARVAAPLQAYSAHRWTRRQHAFPPHDVPLQVETLGVHFHYVVRDAAHWQAKYRKLSVDPDVWLRGDAVVFPKLGWKRAATRMSPEEAERYFARWVAVPDDLLTEHRRRGHVVDAPHVQRVLEACGFVAAPRPARRARRRCRVAFVGLDAADPALVRRWSHEGRLPTLAMLLRETTSACTDPPEGFFVGALWPTWYTAMGPARHGCHCWEQLVPGTYDVVRYLAGREVREPPFWGALARAGRRVALLDVPLSGPTPGFDGVQVLEWGAHDPEEGFRTQPPALADEIVRAVGPHPVQGNCNAWRTADEYVRFRDDLVEGVARRTRLHRLLLERADWDLFVTVYGESHCVGHQCWHLHDPTHARHDPAAAARVGDPVLAVYEAIDRSLAALLDDLGAECTVFVFLSHGMRAHYDPTFLLDEMLARVEAAWQLGVERPLGHRASHLAHAVARRVPAVAPLVERAGASRRAAVAERAAALLAGRPGRAFFQVPNNQVDGAVRLNLVGREPAGIVGPGGHAERVCAFLAADLSAFVDLDSGLPVVERVVRTREVHRGAHGDALPDLYVLWRKAGSVRRVWSPLTGTIARDYDGVRSGDHTPEGLVMLRAPWARAGMLPRRLAVADLAPTLCALLDVSLAGVDGRVVCELLDPAEARSRLAG